jgi:hypothetical protein
MNPAEMIRELERYAPVLRFAASEHFFPIAVDVT